MAEKMRVIEIVEPGKVQIGERTKPEARYGELLIRNKSCGICTFEQRLYTGKSELYYPIVAGHEAAGIIAEVGPGVRGNHKAGDHVALDLLNRCGQCDACRTGHDNLCENRFQKGLNFMGGMGEYVAIPSDQAYKISDGVDYDRAALAEPLSDCIHSFGQAHLASSNKVAIIGAGTMGLLHLLLANHWGMETLVLEVDETKLAKARELGATYVINPAQEDDVQAKAGELFNKDGADTVIITAPGEAPALLAFDLVGIRGTIVFYSANYPPLNIPVNTNEIHYKELNLVGTISRTKKDFFKAVKIINDGKLPLEEVITETYQFTRAGEAFEAALKPDSYRIILNY